MKKGRMSNWITPNLSYQKGITPVIAVVLLLMITIAIIGFAFIFFQSSFSDITTDVGEEVEHQTTEFGKNFRIESAVEGIVYLRNSGASELTKDEITVYIDNVLIDPEDYTLDDVPKDQVGTLTFEDGLFVEGNTVEIHYGLIDDSFSFSTTTSIAECTLAKPCSLIGCKDASCVNGKCSYLESEDFSNCPKLNCQVATACNQGSCVYEDVSYGTPCSVGYCDSFGTCLDACTPIIHLEETASGDLECWSNIVSLSGSTIDYTGEWYLNSNKHILTLWNVAFDTGSVGSGLALGVAVDSQDNVIVAGHNNNPYIDYTVKYDSDGNYLWDATSPDLSSIKLYGVAIDSNDNVIAVGEKTSDGYIIKYDENGVFLWDITITGMYQINSVAIDSNDNIVVVGRGPTTYHYRVYKYNSAGVYLDSASTSSNNYWGGWTGIAVDSNDNVYIIGSGAAIYNLIKFNPFLDVQWSKTYNQGEEVWRSVTVDSNDDIIISGDRNDENDCYVKKYASNGNFIWEAFYAGGSGWNNCYDVDTDSMNNIIMSGLSVETSGNNNYFTVKFDSYSNELWDKIYDSGGVDAAYSVAVDSNDKIIVTGFSNDFTTLKYSDIFGKANVDKCNFSLLDTISASQTSSGQVWYCKVQGFDGIEYSAWLDSNSVTIS